MELTDYNIDEVKQKITTFLEEGLTREEIVEKLNIPVSVLKDIFAKERQDRLLKKAEQTSEDLLGLDIDDPHLLQKYPRQKIKLIEMKMKEAEFIRETLGKDYGYSKRSEVTGKNGGEITIKEVIFSAPVISAPTKKDNG